MNAFVVVQPEDGNLVIYDTNGKAVKGLVGKAIDPSVLPTHLHLQGIVECVFPKKRKKNPTNLKFKKFCFFKKKPVVRRWKSSFV